jgi:hypothetical protein
VPHCETSRRAHPVAWGLVASLSRPGVNLTGTTVLTADLEAETIAIAPSVRRCCTSWFHGPIIHDNIRGPRAAIKGVGHAVEPERSQLVESGGEPTHVIRRCRAAEPSAAGVAMLVNPSNAQNRFELMEPLLPRLDSTFLTASSDDEIDAAFATLVEAADRWALGAKRCVLHEPARSRVALAAASALPAPRQLPLRSLAVRLVRYGSGLSALKNGCGPSTVSMGTKWVTSSSFPKFESYQAA